MDEVERIRVALSFVSPDDRDDWVRYGMAVKCEIGDAGFDLWDTWSQGSESYSPKDAKVVWRSFKDAGAVTIATLYRAAIDAGWRDNSDFRPLSPEELERKREENRRRMNISVAEILENQEQIARKAMAIWRSTEEAPADHPYLVKRQIQPSGARLHKGMLAIPMRIGKKLWSIQFIGVDGKKVFMKDGKMSGCYCSIGTTVGAEMICVVEGFATGATIHAATGHPVAVAFNAGNLLAVAKSMRACGLPIVICADDDHMTHGNPGVTSAVAAADAVGARIAMPAFYGARGDDDTDFNDMQRIHGLDTVRDEFMACIL